MVTSQWLVFSPMFCDTLEPHGPHGPGRSLGCLGAAPSLPTAAAWAATGSLATGPLEGDGSDVQKARGKWCMLRKNTGDCLWKMRNVWILSKKHVDVSIYHGDRMDMISNDVNWRVVSDMFNDVWEDDPWGLGVLETTERKMECIHERYWNIMDPYVWYGDWSNPMKYIYI